MEREKKLVKNTIILSLGTFLPSAVSMLMLPLYTSYLTKKEYGIYDLAITLVSVLIPIITLQIQQAGFRFVIENKDKKTRSQIISNIYFFVIPIAILMTVLLFLCLKKIAIVSRILLCIYLFCTIIQDVMRQVVRGLGDTKVYSLSAIVNATVNMLLAIVFLLVLKMGIVGLFTSLCISIILSIIILGRSFKEYERPSLEFYNKDLIFQMIKYSLPLVPNMISVWIINLSDRLVIAAFMGVEANAIYSIANKIPTIFSQLYTTFNLSWQESASSEVNNKDAAQYYSKIMNLVFDFLFSIMSLTIAVMPFFFRILINKSYDAAFYQMPILMLAMLFASINAFFGGIYLANKRTKNLGMSTVISAVFNLVFNVCFIQYMGLFAASLSTLLSYLLSVIFRVTDIQKEFKLCYNFRKIVICFVFNAILLILCYQRKIMYDYINILASFIFVMTVNKKLVTNIITVAKIKAIKKHSK